MISGYIEPEIEIRRKIAPVKEKMGFPAYSPDKPSIQEEYSFEPITMDKIVKNEQDYIIVGESGIGKTSFLYWTASQIASKNIISGVIPLFLPLKDIAIINTRNDLFSLLDTRYSLAEHDLSKNQLLFLLDGLDQTPNYGNILNRLRNKDIFGKENRIILTTRPIGYEWIKYSFGYEYLRLIPFDEEELVLRLSALASRMGETHQLLKR